MNDSKVPGHSLPARAEVPHGLDVHRHHSGTDQLAADGGHLQQRLLRQVQQECRKGDYDDNSDDDEDDDNYDDDDDDC